jgi:hypothetical protein
VAYRGWYTCSGGSGGGLIIRISEVLLKERPIYTVVGILVVVVVVVVVV